MASDATPTGDVRLAYKHVLIVEDDAILALALEETLREHGVESVEQCSTTEEALRSLQKKQPDAIVLDVHLADRADGWAVAELVDAVGPVPPRIVFSTGAPEDIPDDIAELGVVLEKPYAPETLVEALSTTKRTGLFARLRG